MTDNFDAAVVAARTLARGLIAEGIPADDIANGFIVEAAAVWAALTGRPTDAEKLLAVWVQTRDAEATHVG